MRRHAWKVLILEGVVWFAVALVSSMQYHATKRAEGLFTMEECETGRLYPDSESFLKGADPSSIAAAREDWGLFNIRARVTYRSGERRLLVRGLYVWPFSSENPIPRDCHERPPPPDTKEP